MWVIHPVWMLAALAVGIVAGYLGLIRSQFVRGLPGSFSLAGHVGSGLALVVLLWGGIAVAAALEEPLGAAVGAGRLSLARTHGPLAFACAGLYAVAGILGLVLLVRRRQGRGAEPATRKLARAHLIFNYTACGLALVVVILGVLMVR